MEAQPLTPRGLKLQLEEKPNETIIHCRGEFKVGIASARAKGKRIGRPAANPALVSQVRALVARGQSLRQIGSALGISVAMVHKYSA